MVESQLRDTTASILRTRRRTARSRSTLAAISGIDASGKGHVSALLRRELERQGQRVALINVDGWLNLPESRFSQTHPAEHFYLHALRLDEMFDQLVRLERAVARAQEHLSPELTVAAYHRIYFPAQRIHFARDTPRSAASVIIDNDGGRSPVHSAKWARGLLCGRAGTPTRAGGRGESLDLPRACVQIVPGNRSLGVVSTSPGPNGEPHKTVGSTEGSDLAFAALRASARICYCLPQFCCSSTRIDAAPIAACVLPST